MNPGIHAALAAATAAQEAERLKKQQLEEEMMTKYSEQDLNENWEFKIVRSAVPRFHKPEVFQRLLQEEAIAGWELVEKLDDQRVRFKRRRDARRRDDRLPPGHDPYRTQFGGNLQAASVVVAGTVALLALMGVFGGFFFMRANGGSGGLISSFPVVLVMILLVMIVTAVVFVLIRMRRG